MIETTEKYLQALDMNKSKLVDNLNSKGVKSDKSELFNTLVDKVLLITGSDIVGLSYGEILFIEDTYSFSISGLTALPTAFGLSCERVITDRLSEANKIFISLFCYNPEEDKVTFYKYIDDNTLVFDKVSMDLVYTYELLDDGTYTVTISFAALNEMTQKPYYFKGGYEYNWVASVRELFLQ